MRCKGEGRGRQEIDVRDEVRWILGGDGGENERSGGFDFGVSGGESGHCSFCDGEDNQQSLACNAESSNLYNLLLCSRF